MPDSQKIIDISAFFAPRNGAPGKVQEAFGDASPCPGQGSLDSGRSLGRVCKDAEKASCSGQGSLYSDRAFGRVCKDSEKASCSARGSLEEDPMCGALCEKGCQRLSSGAADNFPERGSNAADSMNPWRGSRSVDSANLGCGSGRANSTNLEPGSVPAGRVNPGRGSGSADSVNPEHRSSCFAESTNPECGSVPADSANPEHSSSCFADSMNPERRDEDSTARQIAARLKKGEVCVLPCDTIYGLSAVWGKAGEAALRSLKARDAGKPFIALATLEQVKNLADVLPMEIEALWPAPLTVILKLKMGGDQAFRVPGNPFLQKILSLTGSPIFSTSVNISGESPLLSFSDIVERFGGKVDFLVKAGESQGSSPSTLLDATSRPYRILRQGVFQVPGTILK